MPTRDDILSWRGQALVDSEGGKIGSIDEIYVDADTNEPEWALVNTGLFGSKSTFVPLQQAAAEGDVVRVPYDKATIKDAPKIDPDGELSQREEAELYRHYGLEYSETRSDSRLPKGGTAAGGTLGRESAGTPGIMGRDVGQTTDTTDRSSREMTGTTGQEFDTSAQVQSDTDVERGEPRRDLSGGQTDDAMTLSEEQLEVDTRERETGRARLKKYIVTDEVQETVQVRREEPRVEREPITDANVEQATSGPELTEAEHEVALHEEEPVVEKRVVPKQRVRLDKDTTTEEREISEQVRREEVDVDDDTGRRTP
jgi:uncharacterized protein (TIGR02271 family)